MATATQTLGPGTPAPVSTDMTSTAPTGPAEGGGMQATPMTRSAPILATTGALAALGPVGTFLQQPAVRKATPAIIVLLVLAVIAGYSFILQEPTYRSVFPGMQEADQQAAGRRQRGIGSALLQEALVQARLAGCRRVTLLTDDVNVSAQRFYARHGFTRSPMLPFRRLLD